MGQDTLEHRHGTRQIGQDTVDKKHRTRDIGKGTWGNVSMKHYLG